ncbi:MAG: hypothetical protein JNK18_03440 [Cyclobacteriaceae bacterium]|nr:hypothetical protein [Cyclobacteriaceae bacterium]
MQSLFFWKNWTREYKFWWYALIVLLLAGLIFLWAGYFRAPQGLTAWNTYQDQQTIESISHTFDVGNFEFVVPIDSYTTFEYYHAGPLQVSTTTSYIFVAVLALMSMVLLTVITTLPRFWYYTGVGLFALFLVSMRLDVLGLFGQRNFTPVIVTAVVFIAVSFYFNAFNTTASFTLRALVFLALTAVLGIIVHFCSAVEHPFLYLSVSSFIPGLIITVLFMFMIAHEILAGFVYLTSQSETNSKSLRHFAVISLIYLVNLVLAYMNEAGFIEWDFVFINLYLLFTVSAILAIWGYKKRDQMFDNIISYYPFGAYFIAGLAVIAFTTTAVMLHSYNDAALRIIRDVIIFSHIGFGVIFILYFTSNFIGMMAANKNVYKVLYSPVSMPYATYRIAGLIATLAFVFYSQWHTYVYYATAGIFNSMADVQQTIEGEVTAEAYYGKARSYAGTNFHSNYNLATLALTRNDFSGAHTYYNSINRKKITESSIINNANVFLLEDNNFEMEHALEAGLTVFPKSGFIENNLGYALFKVNKRDSALLFFDRATKNNTTRESAETNLTALVAKNNIAVQADSLIQPFTKSNGVLSNALIIAGQQHQTLTTPIDPLKNPVLTVQSATLLNNYMVYKLRDLDTTFISRAFKLATDSVNSDYSEALKATLAHAYYYQNNVAQAMALMGEVAYVTQSLQGKFNYTMGLWALEQGNPQLAVSCFAYSVEQDYKDAKTYNAIALAEARKEEQAREAAAALLESRNLSDREIGRQLRKIYATTTTEVFTQTDLEKYQYCRYRLSLTDSTLFTKIINTIDNPNYKALIILEMAQRQFNAGSVQKAIRYFTRLEGIRFTDKNLNAKINHFELELLAARNEVRLLGEKINQGIDFPQDKLLQKMLYTALIQEASGDTLAAQKNYEILAVYNPFFEEGVIAAARFFRDHSAERLKAYTLLAEAKQINPGSIRLLAAYINEATRIGFDDFAADAYAELEEVRSTK